MNRKDINILLSACLNAPDGQLCKSAHQKVSECIDATDDNLHDRIKSLINHSSYFSLASGFTMVLFHTLLKESEKLTKDK